MRRRSLASGSFLLAAVPLMAQDSTKATLAPVIVQVGRDAGRPVLDLPYAVTSITPDSARPGQRHSSIDETLFLIPGVSVFNRNNPAQDARISIRGFGARSAFGVRGIRVLRDGIPLTLPDGQTPIDYLDLENVGRVEVMRGSASPLYGNAGGGVIDIQSSDLGDSPLSAVARAWKGSNRSRKVVGQTGGRNSRFSYQSSASQWTTDGFRKYSAQRATTADVRARYTTGPAAYTISLEGFEMPVAENPGALTLAQLESDPSMADPLSVRKQASKRVKQTQFGLLSSRPIGDGGELRAVVHAGRRSLYNPLTFGIVFVGRHTSGAELRATLPKHIGARASRLTAGLEFQRQADARRNFANCTDLTTPITKATATCAVGETQGATTLDQRELVHSTGLYLGQEIDLSPRYMLSTSARADAVKFAVQDHFISGTNPDDSGERSLHSVSPMAGLTVRLSPTSSFYGNVSTAFETPTATELGNHPDGSAGINQELLPQKSLTWETGIKSISSFLQYGISLFSTGVRDELIPFEIPSSSGRRYFRNAGRTSRRGAELSATAKLSLFDLGLAYTYGDFRYRSFVVAGTSYAGKRIPGVPARELQLSATLHLPSYAVVAEQVLSDRVFVDDANSLSASGFGVLNLRFIADELRPNSGISLIAGAHNVFDRKYVSSVAVNASGGKYFEPGQTRSVYAGFNLSFSAKKPARQ